MLSEFLAVSVQPFSGSLSLRVEPLTCGKLPDLRFSSSHVPRPSPHSGRPGLASFPGHSPSLGTRLALSPEVEILLRLLHHFGEVLAGEALRLLEQVGAGVEVCEAHDAQAVGGVELLLEELAAGVANLGELQEVCGREEGLDVLLRDLHGTSVDEFD